MGSIEERVSELEKRVKLLEEQLQAVSVGEVSKEKLSKSVGKEAVEANIKQPIFLEEKPIIKPNITASQSTTSTTVINEKNKSGEAVVGKYIIGALASLLVFVGAVSLIALVWHVMSDAIKLLLLIVSGLILVTIGFIRVKKHKNPITAILLGTGSGLLFISILAANMAYDFISSHTAFLLAGIWALFFILSYKYTQMLFTSIIAFIGSFIALILGLTLVQTDIDFIVVAVFEISIGLAMLLSGYKWLSDKKQLTCSLLIYFSHTVLIFGGAVSDLSNYWVVYLTVLGVLMFVLIDRIFSLISRLKWIILHVGLSILTTLITIIAVASLESVINFTQFLIIMLVITLIQLLFGEWRGYWMKPSSTWAYTVFLIIFQVLLNYRLFDYVIGISLIALVLLLIDYWKKKSNYRLLSMIIVLLDSHLLFTVSNVNGATNRVFFVIILFLQLGVTTLLLKYEYRKNQKSNLVPIKVIGFMTYITSTFFLVKHVVNMLNIEINEYVIAYLFVTILLLLIMKSGFFKSWISPDFKWFRSDKNIPQEKSVIVVYVYTTLLYCVGLAYIYGVEYWFEMLLMIISVLGMALIQTDNLLRYKLTKGITGVWLGLKYLILVWIVLDATFNLPVESVWISLTGLIMALLSIGLGFKINIKSLRLYGLILTILMVLKFIIVDLSQENSILRVITLLLGGLICFGISLIYNRLNAILISKDADNQ